MRTPQRSRGQARITVGVGPRHYTTAGPSVSHLSPNYTENKYVKRVSIFFLLFFCIRIRLDTVRSLGEIDVLVQESTV